MSVWARLEEWIRGRSVTPAGADPDPPSPAAGTVARCMEDGLDRRRRGELAGAAEAFAQAIELQHDHAEAHLLLGHVYREQGRIEDAADSFQLAAHFAPAIAEIQIDLAAALRALGRLDEAEAACRKAMGAAPWLPEASFEQANLLKARGDLDRALVAYRDALRLKPDYVPALCNLGHTLRALGRFAQAQVELERAITYAPALAEAHHNLGLVLREQGRFAEALARFERALEIRPELVETQACIAHCLADLGRTDEAIAVYDAVLEKKPGFGDAVINRCYAYLQRQDYAAGWEQYERRFDATRTVARRFPYPAWAGEPLSGRALLVHGEQGIGDEIMFASCLPDVLARADRCVIECAAPLAPLFRRSFPGATVHGGAKSDSLGWLAALEPIDCQVPIGGLPKYLRPTADAFPCMRGYLNADPVRGQYWRGRLEDTEAGVKIGISWRGGTLGTRTLLRSISAGSLAVALAGQGRTLVSVQYGDCAEELIKARAESRADIAELVSGKNEIDDLAALLSALDLIVSVDNTVAHLAGALGKPVWVLLSASPEWRYPRAGSTTPWYPSARLFHQRRPGVWEDVFADLRAALDTYQESPRGV